MFATAFLAAMLTGPAYLAVAQDVGNQLLSELQFTGDVDGRIKTLKSTRAKMRNKGLSFDEVTDFVAVRIQVDTEDEAYEVMQAIQSRYDTLPGKDRDYISNPKANGYQSLHTAVELPTGGIAEFQVRTRAMHEWAEAGDAAHWRYKLEA